MRNTMDIDQAPEPDYDSVKIDYVGFVDPYAVEGMVVLKADNGKEFHMRAFSGKLIMEKNSTCVHFLAKSQSTSLVLMMLKVNKLLRYIA